MSQKGFSSVSIESIEDNYRKNSLGDVINYEPNAY